MASAQSESPPSRDRVWAEEGLADLGQEGTLQGGEGRRRSCGGLGVTGERMPGWAGEGKLGSLKLTQKPKSGYDRLEMLMGQRVTLESGRQR